MGYYDLHVHTSYSKDGFCSPKKVVETALSKGLSGVAIVDHNTVEGSHEAKELAGQDFLVIPGVEVSTKHGHVLGLGVEEPVPAGLSAAETVELIRAQGGLAVAAHPFGLGPKPCLALHAEFDAIEVFSPRRYLGNHLARWYAERNHLPMVAGSDAHFANEVGMAGVRLACEPSLDSVLEEIRRGEASVFGHLLPPHEHLWKALQKIIRRCFTKAQVGGLTPSRKAQVGGLTPSRRDLPPPEDTPSRLNWTKQGRSDLDSARPPEPSGGG